MTTTYAIEHAQRFNGLGQSGNWSDAANWTGGVLPSLTSGLGLITMATTLNTSFSAYQLMVLGNFTDTVNGTLSTLNTNQCNSFMVCAHATVDFSPTSVLNDAGGFVVGVLSTGNVMMQGNATSHAVINSGGGKLGQHASSVGNITMDRAVWNIANRLFIGETGQGNMTVGDGSHVVVGDSLGLGVNLGGTGQLTISGGSSLSVGTYVLIGGNNLDNDTPAPAGTGIGTGTITVGSASSLSVTQGLKVSAGSAVSLAGGTVNVTNAYPGLVLSAAATLSGYGTVSVATLASPGMAGIVDGGVIQSSGGTLVLNAPVSGTGSIQVGAGSTLAINGNSIGVPSIAFTGSNGTLALAHGIADHATITGFAAGDSILMAGVDTLGWNASTDVLTLSSGSHVVDTLQFAGTYASNAFTLTESGGNAMIGLAHSSVASH